jgi:hypothetical protein
MTFDEQIKRGRVSKDGWPDTAWFVRDGKVEKVTGWLKIQTLAREDDGYPAEYFGTREAAEGWLQATHHPVEYAAEQYRNGEITELELRQAVGELEARKVFEADG